MIYEFSPKQDLHGYEKPWAPGAGTNKFGPNETFLNGRFLNSAGNITPAPGWMLSDYIKIAPNTLYTFNPNSDYGASACFGFYDADKQLLSTIQSSTLSFDTPENAAFMRFSYRDISYNIQLEIGNNVSPYTPYANICPLIGYNIYDPETESLITVYAGYVNNVTRELFLRPVYPEYAGETLVGPWISSMDEYREGGTPTEGAFVVDLGGELSRYEITDFQLQSLLSSLGIRLFFKNGATLLNSLMDQAQGRIRSQVGGRVLAIGNQLPSGLTIKPITNDVIPKFIKQEEIKNADG